MNLYASAYHGIPGKFELTVKMARIMFPYFPLVALAAAYMGILNACSVFFLPALMSAIFNVVSITVGVGLAEILFHAGPRYGILPIEGMAIGVVAGGVVQAFLQLPALYRAGYRWEKKRPEDPVWHKDPALRQMLWMMVPGTVGLAATQVNILVNTILATSQGSGPVSWLSYAFRLMQFPIGIFGVSLAAATLPRVSRQWVERDVKGVCRTISQSLRHVFAINLPASAGLAFLGVPIIQLIFQYGRFRVESTHATALALAMYSIGLAAYSSVKVLVPACYALGNTRVPVISSALAVVLTIALNVIMVRPFGYWGLALGTSIAAIFNAIFLLFSIRKMVAEAGGHLEAKPLFRSFFQSLGVALVMGAGCWITYHYLEGWFPDELWARGFGHGFERIAIPMARFFRVGLVLVEGLMLVVVLARLFRLTDVTEVVNFFMDKLKKKLRPRPT